MWKFVSSMRFESYEIIKHLGNITLYQCSCSPTNRTCIITFRLIWFKPPFLHLIHV
jgi:hypothetical protein